MGTFRVVVVIKMLCQDIDIPNTILALTFCRHQPRVVNLPGNKTAYFSGQWEIRGNTGTYWEILVNRKPMGSQLDSMGGKYDGLTKANYTEVTVK